MKHTALKPSWILLVIFAAMFEVFSVDFAQQSATKSSSYAPVVMKKDFATTMARMKAAKPEVMECQTALLNQRYDLGNRVLSSWGDPSRLNR